MLTSVSSTWRIQPEIEKTSLMTASDDHRTSRSPKVRRATSRDIEEITGVLTRAFYDDPVAMFMFPSNKRRLGSLAKFFRFMLAHQYMKSGEVWTTDDLAGASLWAPPNKARHDLREVLHFLPVFPQLIGPNIKEALRLIGRIEAKRPKREHWYLSTLGTDPPRQGEGVGSALVANVLERCDSDGIPAYLESTKESNVSFYGHHGFKVTGQIHTPAPGPTLHLMWRDPR